MTTLTTRRSWTVSGLVLVALGAFVAARAAPPPPPAGAPGSMRPFAPRPLRPRFAATRGFYETHIAPRISADAHSDDAFNAAALGNPAAGPWTIDPAAVARVEKTTIRSIASAFKGYAIEQLRIDHWSFPVVGRNGRASFTGESRAVRFHLGFSRLAPRADLLIPVTAGRVALSVDARGRLRVTLDPSSSRFRLAADVDVPDHTATVGLRVRF